ncbi:lytic transglycosylase domain-containing protein [Cronobacter malonaticus]|uniref:lytic transglycosylase domain-containing protein n=1 Tax=Cronobacter malonaticus TaxID=413503 RepID=UPI001F26A1D0|nr:lytic transglycosylase domain-containing protein [Cronobacter malonaticus]
MIIQELAYKVTLRADEFLNGKRKVGDEVSKLEKDFERTGKNINRTLKTNATEFTQFGQAAVSSFRGITTAAAGFLGVAAGLYGVKQLFTSTANEIVRASQQAKFFGTDVNKVFGVRRGFQQAGLNGDAFISAAGNARMALANIADPTIFGGLTGSAQNLITLGARTGLNISKLGDPTKALGEFTRYSRNHSQENLMQVMAAAGFDPTDAAKIKSGELKQLVDNETKRSNITAQQVKEQEALVATLGQLDSEFDRIRQDIAIAFAPEVMDGLKAFGGWIKDHHGDIIGFFRDAGDKIKSFTDAVGGAENALKILAGLYIGKNALGLASAAGVGGGGKGFGAFLGRLGLLGAGIFNSGDIADATTPDSVLKMRDEDKPFIYQKHWLERLLGIDYQDDNSGVATNPGGRTLADRNNNPGNIRGRSGQGGFAGYSSEQEGWDAISNQLMRYYNGQTTGRRLRTVKDIISTWAPDSENDTESYIKQVASYMGVSANDQLNLADPNVMAKLRTAMARKEGFSNWQNGLKISGSHQFQNQYYLQQQSWANARRESMTSSIDNSKSSVTKIDKVVVNSNPQTVDALTQSINSQSQRSGVSATFASSVK